MDATAPGKQVGPGRDGPAGQRLGHPAAGRARGAAELNRELGAGSEERAGERSGVRDGERCAERSGERAVQPAAAGARRGGRSALRAVPGSPRPVPPAPLARPAQEMDPRSESPRRLLAPP